MGKAVISETGKRNRLNPGQTLDIPNFITSIWAIVLPKQVCKTAGAKIYGITATVISGIKHGCGTGPATCKGARVGVCADRSGAAKGLGNQRVDITLFVRGAGWFGNAKAIAAINANFLIFILFLCFYCF